MLGKGASALLNRSDYMHKNIRLLKWLNFFWNFRLYAPIIIIYFAQITGSFASALLIFSIFSIAISVFEIPTGIYSDMIGRKKTLVLGSLVSVISLTCYALGGSFLILALGAIFAGLQESFFSGNNDALLYDSLGETKEQNSFGEHTGKINSVLQLAIGTSALIGGLIAGISFKYVLWLSVIPQVIALIMSFWIIEPKTHFEKMTGNIFANLKEAFVKFQTNFKLRNLSLSSILSFGMGEVANQFMPAFINTVWPVWALGISKGIAKTCSFFSSRSAGKILKRFSSFRVLIVGTLASIGTTILAVVFVGVWSPLLIALTSIPYAITAVALSSLLQAEFSDQQRATMGSINSLFGNIFFAIFAYGFGLVADHFGKTEPIVITEILTLSVVYIYWKLFKNHKKELLAV
ncbi:MFS transporter [Candidatus Uhrbacteria bacterium]|nr:MFS transporter [Candidatus Uhrbacteria bacterium]